MTRDGLSRTWWAGRAIVALLLVGLVLVPSTNRPAASAADPTSAPLGDQPTGEPSPVAGSPGPSPAATPVPAGSESPAPLGSTAPGGSPAPAESAAGSQAPAEAAPTEPATPVGSPADSQAPAESAAPTDSPASTEPPAPTEPPTPTPPPVLGPDCANDRDPVARADELLADGYRLGEWPLITLPPPLTWAEDPLHDANWRFQLHSMRYVLDLMAAWRETGSTAYLDRALFLLQDWIRHNPRYGAPSDMSWSDHSTALRGVVLVCVSEQVPMTDWLRSALVLHGTTLADPAFYRGEGNHALDQAIGLLEIGRVLGRADWVTLAGARINSLIVESIDHEGVTNEQSVGYQMYNYKRYQVARGRMLAAGLTPGAAFERLDRMPEFLAYATLPNGRYEMIGDTVDATAGAIPGTVAEFAATAGASGPKPASPIRLFERGYLFVRSGWGEQRAFADDTAISVKWGAAPVFHGHPDGGQLTLAAWGSRLLVDPGLYAYYGGATRSFIAGRTAHNIVTVDGLAWNRSATTSLLAYKATSRYVDIRMRTYGYRGVTHVRRVTYSRGMDYLLVEDRLTSSTTRTYRQLWHLVHDARPWTGVSTVLSQRPRGNVLVRQLAGSPSLRIVKGATNPMQGWISYRYGERTAAPVVEAVQRGRTVRYLTLIVPARGRPSASVSRLSLTSAGYSVTIRIGSRSERITTSGSSVWLTPLTP